MEIVGISRTIGDTSGQGLLTVKEAASYLGVSPCSVYRWVEEGRIPHIKLQGRGVRFKQSDLDTWLERGKSRPLPCPSDLGGLTMPPRSTMKRSHVETGGTGEMAKAKSRTRSNFGYGAIYQRKSRKWGVRWYIDFKDASGKRIQRLARHAESQQEAAMELQKVVREELSRSPSGAVRKENAKFEEFAEVFFQDYVLPNYKKGVLERSRINGLVAFFRGSDLRDVTHMMVERFRAHRLKLGNSKATVNRYLALMKRMYNLAINEGLASENPVKKVKFYSEADSVKERILTYVEEKMLMSFAEPHLKPILVVALNTGMRFSEIMNLEWNHIDFTAKRIRVEKTKSGKVRFININAPLLSELVQLKARAQSSPYLFPNPKTAKPFTLVRRSFSTACRKAGIQGLRFHDLRHTFATRLLQKGVDIETVRTLLGHFSIVVTQRYTHSNNEMKQRAVELLELETGSRPPETGANLLQICDKSEIGLSQPVVEIPPTSSESVN
jgi:excisionase family DNA binding protein